jgi:hypothetical protein
MSGTTEEMKEISVEVGPHMQTHKFTGKLLGCAGSYAIEHGYETEVYQTKRGQIAVWQSYDEAPSTLETFATVDAADLPKDIKDDVLVALGLDLPEIKLDI